MCAALITARLGGAPGVAGAGYESFSRHIWTSDSTPHSSWFNGPRRGLQRRPTPPWPSTDPHRLAASEAGPGLACRRAGGCGRGCQAVVDTPGELSTTSPPTPEIRLPVTGPGTGKAAAAPKPTPSSPCPKPGYRCCSSRSTTVTNLCRSLPPRSTSTCGSSSAGSTGPQPDSPRAAELPPSPGGRLGARLRRSAGPGRAPLGAGSALQLDHRGLAVALLGCCLDVDSRQPAREAAVRPSGRAGPAPTRTPALGHANANRAAGRRWPQGQVSLFAGTRTPRSTTRNSRPPATRPHPFARRLFAGRE